MKLMRPITVAREESTYKTSNGTFRVATRSVIDPTDIIREPGDAPIQLGKRFNVVIGTEFLHGVYALNQIWTNVDFEMVYTCHVDNVTKVNPGTHLFSAQKRMHIETCQIHDLMEEGRI